MNESALPDELHILVSKLRAEHIGELVAIDGVIRKVTEVRPMITTAVFECRRCGATTRAEQDDEFVQSPSQCDICRSKGQMRLDESSSTYINYQKVELQESHEVSTQPESIAAYLFDDLVQTVKPGDRVCINGTISLIARRDGQKVRTDFTKILRGVSVEMKESAFEDIHITESDKQSFNDMVSRGNPLAELRESFLPSIYGLQEIKEAGLLSLVGGVSSEASDGSKRRGDIHMLMVGDPGVAKSMILYGLRSIAPRCVMTAGKGASAAGLTAAAVKDDFGEGRWTLEAGAMVLADRGTMLLDEMDKMDKNDTAALHQAMEQQEISISKAGLTANMKTRCNVIAAANPIHGRYDPDEPMAEQINLPPALLSRFDVIFPIIDKADKERDGKVARHVLRGGKTTPPLSPEYMRKFISHAKSFTPTLTEAANVAIETYYLDLRDNPLVDNITVRQLESLRRMTEAAARVRLSNVADEQDAQTAIRIHRYYMNAACLDTKTGKFDAGNVSGAGGTRSQHDRITLIENVVRELSEIDPRGYTDERAVIDTAARKGLTHQEAEKSIDTLKRNSRCFQPGGPGTLRVLI